MPLFVHVPQWMLWHTGSALPPPAMLRPDPTALSLPSSYFPLPGWAIRAPIPTSVWAWTPAWAATWFFQFITMLFLKAKHRPMSGVRVRQAENPRHHLKGENLGLCPAGLTSHHPAWHLPRALVPAADSNPLLSPHSLLILHWSKLQLGRQSCAHIPPRGLPPASPPTPYALPPGQRCANKVGIVKAMVFPAVMYRCESLTIKNAECQRIGVFELWCWRRLLRVPWTARRSNQFILKEINPEYSLEGLMLKPKLQYHLMRRADSLEKTLMLRKTEGGKRRVQQRLRWLDGIH